MKISKKGLCRDAPETSHYGLQHLLREVFVDYSLDAELNKNIEVLDRYLAGLTAMRANNLEKAVADFTNVISLNSNSSEAYYHRGLCDLNLGKYDLAIEDFERVLKIDSNSVEVYYYLGIAYFGLNKNREADENLTEFIRLSLPGNSFLKNAYDRRAAARAKINDYLGAIEDYSRSIDLDPDNASLYFYRAIIYTLMADDRLAKEDYTKAIALNPNYAQAYFNRGDFCLQLADISGAIQDYQKAADLYRQIGDISNYKKVYSRLTKLRDYLKV
ncbi:MAG: tetratricopeptide repeat protein [Prochloraceae cyanobacterium]